MHKHRLGCALLVALALPLWPVAAAPARAAEPKSSGIRINFQPEDSGRVCGYRPDTGKVFAPRWGLEYGWSSDHTDVMRDREMRGNQLLDTLAHFHAGAVWEIAVANGPHVVRVAIGDEQYPSTHSLRIEGQEIWRDAPLEAGQFLRASVVVEVADGRLTLDQGGAPDKATRINLIEIDDPDGLAPGCGDLKEVPEAPEPPPLPEYGETVGNGTVGGRPYGLRGLKSTFGRACNDKANDARTYFPSAGGRGTGGYVYYHSKLAQKVGRGVVQKAKQQNRLAAFDYGIWGYSCRMKTGGTTWSVHSWGAAIDTNTLRNPWQARRWNGRGANGKKYGDYLPGLFLRQNFYWGINFRDPMHFQYVSGY